MDVLYRKKVQNINTDIVLFARHKEANWTEMWNETSLMSADYEAAGERRLDKNLTWHA